MSRTFSLLSLILILTSCASVPFSTMLQLSSMDETDLIRINPVEVRAKIDVEEPAQVDVDKTKITIEIENSMGAILHKFPLVLVSSTQLPTEQGFFSDSPARTEYILKFSETAIESFEHVQASLLNQEEGQMSLSVGTSFGDLPEEVDVITFSIHLKLSENENYITLFDEAAVDIKREQ